MIIVAGPSCSGKTTFVRKLVSVRSKSFVKTLDFKFYSYSGSFILDTPCFIHYELSDFFSKVLLCMTMEPNIDHLFVLFTSNSQVDRGVVYRIYELCCKYNIDFVVYDVSGDSLLLDNNHCFAVVNYCQLYEYIESYISKLSTDNIITYGNNIMLTGITGVGKSTLINKLLGSELVRVSDRNTTKEILRFNVNIGDSVYSMYDTYGLVNKTKYTFSNIGRVIRNVKLVILVVDTVSFNYAVNRFIIKLLQRRYCRFVLLLNKVDLVPNRQVRDQISFLQSMSSLTSSDIIRVSAINDSREYIVDKLKQVLEYKVNLICDKKLTRAVKEKFKKVLFISSTLDKLIAVFKIVVKNNNVLTNSEVRGIKALIVNACCIRLNSIRLVIC